MTAAQSIPGVGRDGDGHLYVLAALMAVAGIAIKVAGVGVAFPSQGLVVLEVLSFLLLYGLVILGLNVQFGYTGLVNFGPVLFFAVGAYTTAMLASTAGTATSAITFGLPWVVALVAGVVLAGVVGGLLGVTTLELRGDYLAIVTLAAAEIFHGVAFSLQNITGGQNGIGQVPTIFEASTNEASAIVVILVLGGLLLASYGVINRLTESPYGRVLRAIRSDEDATEALGKPTFDYKLWVMVYGAALMGLAGGLLALFNGAMAPGFITIDLTVTVWVAMLIGGAGNHRGVLGGLVIVMGFRLLTRFFNQAFPVSQTEFASLRLMMLGLLLIVIIRYRPEGLWGNPEEMEVS
ncbi:MAG: branched-chain amino acid ABC transporter permease [Halobacteriota archaeon]